ncbi:MAG TPA: aminotransferase class V-fold PLP-dependent enzyme [Bacillota bacterium]|nr:aminotransferase class V-fold PLP-dependent enzyme [Bacillota bacterium]HOL08725.1 aminotransferase class V-fold PLP-dependent enzyme [Bacillota bacterium]HPO96372.1 aminotransferase class V-fold PLP-dependent enzyme [Bacillota bacterium]
MLNLSKLVYGIEKKVMTKNGLHQYINLDNAASTPPFISVMKRIIEESAWYSSIHRGTGYKSQYMTEQYEHARQVIANFVNADLDEDVVIFTKNSTDSLNKLSYYLEYLPGELVIYTRLEHHSNELPWQKYKNHCVGVKDGVLDIGELETVLKANRGKVKLVAITGASNVTGYIPPIYTIAELAHEYGAKIAVDGAQLIPHKPFNKSNSNDPKNIDFLIFSGHKIYAPFGAGVLIGPRQVFTQGPPSQPGGGTVKGLTPETIIWMDPPDKEEAGSPNVLGALAIAEACETINSIGWKELVDHETSLINYAYEKISQIPGIILYSKSRTNQVGVISFNIQDIPHNKIAQALAEYGIGVRSGCFCARRLVLELMKVDIKTLGGLDKENLPGMVRISFGCYNKKSDIDLLCKALLEIINSTIKH